MLWLGEMGLWKLRCLDLLWWFSPILSHILTVRIYFYDLVYIGKDESCWGLLIPRGTFTNASFGTQGLSEYIILCKTGARESTALLCCALEYLLKKIRKRSKHTDCGCIWTLRYLWAETEFSRVPCTEQHQGLVRFSSHPLDSFSEILLVLLLPLHIFAGRANFVSKTSLSFSHFLLLGQTFPLSSSFCNKGEKQRFHQLHNRFMHNNVLGFYYSVETKQALMNFNSAQHRPRYSIWSYKGKNLSPILE